MANDMTGAEVVLEWTPSDGPMAGQTITLSTYGLEYNPEDTANIIRTTSFAEAAQKHHTKKAGLIDGKTAYQFKYQRGDRATYAALAAATAGVFAAYDEGKVNGGPKEARNAIIAKRGRAFKVDDLLVVAVDFEFSGPPTYSTYTV